MHKEINPIIMYTCNQCGNRHLGPQHGDNKCCSNCEIQRLKLIEKHLLEGSTIGGDNAMTMKDRIEELTSYAQELESDNKLLKDMLESSDMVEMNQELHSQLDTIRKEYGTLMGEWSNAMADCGAMRSVLGDGFVVRVNNTPLPWCPICQNASNYGHALDCKLDDVLSGASGKKLLEKMDKMRELLKKCVYGYCWGGENYCISCGSPSGEDHVSDCKWVEVTKV